MAAKGAQSAMLTWVRYFPMEFGYDVQMDRWRTLDGCP